MKRTKLGKFGLLAFSIIALTSCSTTYQVFEVKSPDLQEKNNYWAYENEDCIVSYDLWSESGRLVFCIINKTDRNIFIDKEQTFFIRNGEAEEYFRNSEYSSSLGYNVSQGQSTSTQSSSGYLNSLTNVDYNSFSNSASNSKFNYYTMQTNENTASISMVQSVKEKEKRYECIPPRAKKYFGQYSFAPVVMLDCDNVSKKNSENPVPFLVYSQESSPITIVNRIAYSFNENGSDLKHFENLFWVSSITNYSESRFFKNERIRVDCYNNSVWHTIFMIAAPNKFYEVIRK